MRVLIVEDEKKIAGLIEHALKAEGVETVTLHDGVAALPRIKAEPFDVLVLDIMLPGRDGLSVVREMRAQGNTTAVLLISARGEVGERIHGLDCGADDYLPKPFVLAELVARVRALGRRLAPAKTGLLKVGDLHLDPITRTARRGGNLIELASREYKLLEYLMRSAGTVCARVAIIENVWDYHFDPGTNLVDVYIMRLREKIDHGYEPKLLHTVRGIGYVLREGP